MSDQKQTPDRPAQGLAGAPLLEVRDLHVTFDSPGGEVRAVDGVSFVLHKGETIGLVGESGCGKSSLARAILRLTEPTAGAIRFKGEDILSRSRSGIRALRRHIQVIFHGPYNSLDPRFSVRRIISERWKIFPEIIPPERYEARLAELLNSVGLNPSDADHYPHQFSGGQRQLIGIARALALEPEVIICDEPVSALDVSVQAQVINLLERLQRDFGLSYLFIARDLSVVHHIADRVLVMYLGEPVTCGENIARCHFAGRPDFSEVLGQQSGI